MGLAGFLLVRTVEVTLIIVLILVMPSIPPNSTFTAFKVTPAQELKGKLAINNRLDNIEHIYADQLKGAEAFTEYNGELYSSLYTGEVVKLSKGQIVPIVKFGKPCAGHHEERICGRPLGLEFDKQGMLYVADAYYGIWRVDVKTGQKTLLVSMDEEIEGKKPAIPNAIALSENGDFYWTDSSTQFQLEDGIFDILSDGTGRLIHYNAKTKTNKVLMDGLHFANGVRLSSGEEFLIVSETTTSRIYRYYLKGPKAGTHDIFVDGLPGLPDNINSDGQDGFLIALIVARDTDNPLIMQVIAPHPWLRKFVARLFGITEASFKTIHKIYPTSYSQWVIHLVGHFDTVRFFIPSRTTILHYSKTGELLESLHGTDNTFGGVSEAFIHGDHLYLGSPFNTFIGRISLEKAGLEHLRRKREIPAQPKIKITTTTPKPVVTTQAPKPTPAPVREVRNEPPAPQLRPEELKVITKPPLTVPPTRAPTKQPSQPKEQPAKPKEQPAKPKEQPPQPKAQPPQPKVQSAPKQAPPLKVQSTVPPASEKKPPQPAANQKQPSIPSDKKETPKVVPVKESTVPRPKV